MTNATKITVIIRPTYFFAIYEARNVDNARTLGIWFDDKLRELYATNDDFTIVRRPHILL